MAKRQIKYTNRDFDSVLSDIQNYAKQYFPDYFNKFTSEEYSIEKLLSEIIAYQSDVLNYYIDDRYAESYIQHAMESESIFRNAKRLGYKPNTVSISVGEVEFSQLVPATLSGSTYIPDTGSAGVIKENTVLSNTSGEYKYYTLNRCDMKNYNSASVEQSSSNNPTFFRVYNTTQVRSGNKKRKTISVGDPESYRSVMVDKNVAYIENVEDSEGNK